MNKISAALAVLCNVFGRIFFPALLASTILTGLCLVGLVVHDHGRAAGYSAALEMRAARDAEAFEKRSSRIKEIRELLLQVEFDGLPSGMSGAANALTPSS